MALVETVKKGGPYTKKEQDSRRQEVFSLHFEKGYSAIKISEMLNINRNTINEDIRYWYSELAQELKHDVTTWAIEQFHSFEGQKNRLIEQLEKEELIQHKLAIEKLIFQINDKLSQLITKIISSTTALHNPKYDQKLTERTIDLIKYILLNENIEPKISWSLDDIMFHAIKRYQCDSPSAFSIFQNMERLGLDLCKVLGNFGHDYDLLKFVKLRNFLSGKEIRDAEKRFYDKLEEKRLEEEHEERFIKKYGPMSKWTNEIWKEYESDDKLN